jgi:uncharacterized protein YjbJ (UPF0337 family)
MGTEERVNATAKNIEGKTKEMMGDVTGDPQQKAEGEMKQTEAQAQHAKEDIKDKAKEHIDRA